MARAVPAPSNKRYFPVLLNVSEYLDDYDVALTDILLAIVTEMAAAFREEAGIELKDNYFAKRLNAIKELALSDVELKEGELPAGPAKLKIQLLKTDPTARQKVRDALRPHMSSLLEEINLLFDEARVRLAQAKMPKNVISYNDIVLIVDNLEKIQKFEGLEEGLKSQRELFLERYTQLTGMKVHVIYTVPLRLIRSSDSPQLEQRYGPTFVLPMVKVCERGTHAPYPKGIEFLRELLRKRLQGHALEDVFTPGALEFLLQYSGGHVRNLMSFIQSACTYASSIPIPVEAVHRAIQQSVRLFSTSIPEPYWAKLAQLAASSDQQIPNGDPDYLVMLENLSVLEYINGGAETNPFAPAEPWYAVNPIVRELQKFKAAADTLAKS